MNRIGQARLALLSILFFLFFTFPSLSQDVLVEAESFQNPGGWVVDQQFMDQMGSPYLLAHGLGAPVADATTSLTFPAAGDYHVWVRTRDWANAGANAPGQFQVIINGVALATVFGTEDANWHWQDGGAIAIADPQVSLALHDLTGFEGRCDAIAFTVNPSAPSNEGTTMTAYRRATLGLPDEPEFAGAYDMVVVGGGMAGTCASLSAARWGLRVALIQDRPVVGGNNSSEVRVWLGGSTNYVPYPRIGSVLMEMNQYPTVCPGPASQYDDNLKWAVVQPEKKLTPFMNYRANEVRMNGARIQSVIAQNVLTGRRLRFDAPLFADCTGDACLGFLAGADYEMTTATGHMGPSNMWLMADTGTTATFPSCPWALNLTAKPFPGSNGDMAQLGKWFWESGFFYDPIVMSEHIRDWNLLAMYGAWDRLKNVDHRFPKHKLSWAAYIAGKRESRRLMGELVLTRNDLMNSVVYSDGAVPTSWDIDFHIPHPSYVAGFESDPFISKDLHTAYPRPYWIPYRCLYSRTVPNLFMAGRHISVKQDALGTVRVMRTTGMMGEIVGLAAVVCREQGAEPRDVYAQHLSDLKLFMEFGAGPDRTPAWRAHPGPNLAQAATIAVSGSYNTSQTASSLNDGLRDLSDNSQRWLSDTVLPHVITFSWGAPQTISAARIISGYTNANTVTSPISDFELQYLDGAVWVSIPGTQCAGNTNYEWRARFAPVLTKGLRLVVTSTPSSISRIWEIELFNPSTSSSAPGQTWLVR
ncbi:MAG: FAD-dependent oxidoreductase [Candidatus Sumerlaeota bacterium]|nr:FAD-dependent oxidoreductase [Candidatus Sumerlaeota bacterium]